MMAEDARLSEARRRLTECPDFTRLCQARHQLIDGVVLTSVSAVPTEISFKCARCAAVFWFENLSWREGGCADWRLAASASDTGVRAAARASTDQDARTDP